MSEKETEVKKPSEPPFDWEKMVEFVLAGIPQQAEQTIIVQEQLRRLISFAEKLGLTKAAKSLLTNIEFYDWVDSYGYKEFIKNYTCLRNEHEQVPPGSKGING